MLFQPEFRTSIIYSVACLFFFSLQFLIYTIRVRIILSPSRVLINVPDRAARSLCTLVNLLTPKRRNNVKHKDGFMKKQRKKIPLFYPSNSLEKRTNEKNRQLDGQLQMQSFFRCKRKPFLFVSLCFCLIFAFRGCFYLLQQSTLSKSLRDILSNISFFAFILMLLTKT